MTPSYHQISPLRDPLELVLAEVDPGGVAPEGHVERQLVELSTDRQRLALVRVQGQAVVAWHHRLGDHELGVEQRVEHPRPRPADGGGGAR
jgi:hypothetical protein